MDILILIHGYTGPILIHNTKLHPLHPQRCSVIMNLRKSPPQVREGCGLLFSIHNDVSSNCRTIETVPDLGAVWGTGMKSVASNSNKFHSMFKFSHISISCSILEMINSLSLSLLTSFSVVYYTIVYLTILFPLKCKIETVWFFWGLMHYRLFVLHL